MSAPTLPDTLARLAERLPDRVKNVGYSTCRVVLGDTIWTLDLDDATQYGPWLEYALREECEARKWLWNLEACDWVDMPPFRTAISGRDGMWKHVGYADSPAHALGLALLAVLAALEAQQ